MQDVLPHYVHIGDAIDEVAAFVLSQDDEVTRVDMFLVHEDVYTLSLAADCLCCAASILQGTQKDRVLKILEEISKTFGDMEAKGWG